MFNEKYFCKLRTNNARKVENLLKHVSNKSYIASIFFFTFYINNISEENRVKVSVSPPNSFQHSFVYSFNSVLVIENCGVFLSRVLTSR